MQIFELWITSGKLDAPVTVILMLDCMLVQGTYTVQNLIVMLYVKPVNKCQFSRMKKLAGKSLRSLWLQQTKLKRRS